MFDFLFDNPIVFIAVIFALSRLLKGKKKAAEKATSERPVARTNPAAEEARRRAAARADGAATEAPTLDQRLEQLALDWQAKIEGKTSPQMVTSPGEPIAAAGDPRPVSTSGIAATPLAAASRRAASLESTSLESTSLDTRSLESGSLDAGSLESAGLDAGSLEASSADPRWIESTSSDAFNYHAAIQESESKAYHLDSFTGFHSATGTRTGGRAEGGALEEIDAAGASLFTSEEDLRRAFILGEVLGRPRAHRPLARR